MCLNTSSRRHPSWPSCTTYIYTTLRTEHSCHECIPAGTSPTCHNTQTKLPPHPGTPPRLFLAAAVVVEFIGDIEDGALEHVLCSMHLFSMMSVLDVALPSEERGLHGHGEHTSLSVERRNHRLSVPLPLFLRACDTGRASATGIPHLLC